MGLYLLGVYSIGAIFIIFWNVALLIVNENSEKELICIEEDDRSCYVLRYQWYELSYYCARFIVYFSFYSILSWCGCTKKV